MGWGGQDIHRDGSRDERSPAIAGRAREMYQPDGLAFLILGLSFSAATTLLSVYISLMTIP
jgi:hypothetical protein